MSKLIGLIFNSIYPSSEEIHEIHAGLDKNQLKFPSPQPIGRNVKLIKNPF